MTICKNCGNSFEGNFCNNCGQKAKTERLDWKYISDEAKYTFLHFNGGLTYTLKQLATRPGFAVRDFIEGKRVKHYKPILLLFVLAGIYGLLMHYLDISVYLDRSEEQKEAVKLQKMIMEWQIGHYSLMEILVLPLLAFASWLSFRKSGYNYIEHFILSAFLASLRLIYSIAIFPLIYFTTNLPNALAIHFLMAMPSYLLSIWAYKQFFNEKSVLYVIGRLLLMMLILIILFVVIIILLSVIVAVFFPHIFTKAP